MVIYEVNLAINADIYDEYYPWLVAHVKEMLSFAGFKKAELGQIVDETEPNQKNIRVCYSIDTFDDLQQYFAEHAPMMRGEAIKRFGDGFSATRRIILDPITIQ